MKRSRNTLIVMLAIFLLLGSLPAAAVEHPLALHGAGKLTMVSPTEGALVAAGTATPLGYWTQVGKINITLDGPPEIGDELPATGEVTFTAANGDTLHATFDSVLTITTTNPLTGIATGVFVFDRGTGRFEGVSGNGNFVVMQNLDTGYYELTGVGTIDY
jgi:hypothetical protein